MRLFIEATDLQFEIRFQITKKEYMPENVIWCFEEAF